MTKLLPLWNSPHYVKVLAIFAITSLLAIFSTTGVLSHLLATRMTDAMMMRDAVVSTEFLNSIFVVEEADPRGAKLSKMADSVDDPEAAEFFRHVSKMPDVFRANVYSSSGEVLWSSDPELVGRVFGDNDELDAALRGELDPELVIVSRGEKLEHVGLPEDADEFIEFYIPIYASDKQSIIGAVEVYKAPRSLLASIHSIVRFAWLGAAVSGAVLFAALCFVVYYSTRLLRQQELRLVETERLAVVGQMASAVAHGLRNPLASIRSSAELVAEDALPEDSRMTILDITDQVDRMETWIRSFLTRSQPSSVTAVDTANVDQVVHRCIEGFSNQFKNRGIRVLLGERVANALVAAKDAEVEQVLNTVVSNAVEAMADGGTLEVGWRTVPGGLIAIEVCDTGPGMSKAQLDKLFVPFQTGKAAGLGVGLELGRRIAERLGGTLDLKNRSDRGVAATLTLPTKA